MEQPSRNENEITYACQNPLHPDAIAGVECFNRAEYFEAHESLESAWRDEPNANRDLCRAILLAAVTILHMQRNNFEGALKVSRRCLKWLAPFGEVCCGVQVGMLRRQILTINQNLEQEGAIYLQRFNFSGVIQIDYNHHHPIALPEIPLRTVKSIPKE